MPDYFTQNWAKARAEELVGKKVWFTEVDGAVKTHGIVVGYYWNMAKVIIECDHEVRWPVDPALSYFTMLRPLRQHGFTQYAMVDPGSIDTNRPSRSSLRPHECPRCHWPCLMFFRTVECTNISCQNYKA